ncbi:50S ribosomal protein L7/L12 [Candidatus Marinamargulisbacteria bacterium SCGC AG-343-D04]|nr:50S ribosomal protein L7/L12 [Candidatus Marinamargulisbacteria bacterium SCGC AG-343-D04]
MSEETTKTEEKTTELSKESKKMIEQIEGMTVLELSHLVKALEDKFGVVAAAPVAVAAGGPAAGQEGGDDSSSTVSVVLTDCGDKKIQVLKVVREITGLGLKEAKEIVDSAPKAIKEGIEKAEAEEIKKKLEEQGGKVELK